MKNWLFRAGVPILLLSLWLYAEPVAFLWNQQDSVSRAQFAPERLSGSLAQGVQLFAPLDDKDGVSDFPLITGTGKFEARDNYRGVRLDASQGSFLDLAQLKGFDFQKDFSLAFWVWPNEVQSGEEKGLFNLIWLGSKQDTTKPMLSFWARPWRHSFHLSAWGNSFDENRIRLVTGRPFEVVISRHHKQGLTLWIDGRKAENPFVRGLSIGKRYPFELDIIQIGSGYSPSTGLAGIYGGLLIWDRALNAEEVRKLREGTGWSRFLVPKLHRFATLVRLLQFIGLAGAINWLLIPLIRRSQNARAELLLLLLVNDGFFFYISLFT